MTWSGRMMAATVFASLVGVAGNVVASQEDFTDSLTRVAAIVTYTGAVFAAAVSARAASVASPIKKVCYYVSSGLCMVSAACMGGAVVIGDGELKTYLAAASAVSSFVASFFVFCAEKLVEEASLQITASVLEKQHLRKIQHQFVAIKDTIKRAQRDPMLSRRIQGQLNSILTCLENVQEYETILKSASMTRRERLDMVAILKYYVEKLSGLCSQADLKDVLSLVEIECITNRLEIMKALLYRLEDVCNQQENLVRV